MIARWGIVVLIILAGSLYMAASIAADNAAGLKTDKQRFSYAVGLQIGSSLQRDGMDVDGAAIGMAINDVLEGKPPRLSEEQLQQAFQTFQQQQAKQMESMAAQNRIEGQAYQEKNSKQKGVTVLPNGLQYSIVTKGSGKQPKATDTVVVHYRGTLVSGAEFDSSYKRGQPAEFPVNGVIKGWQELLPMMKEGAKWQVVIPSDLAYGPQGAGGMIGPDATLLFEIELLSIK